MKKKVAKYHKNNNTAGCLSIFIGHQGALFESLEC